jgi:AraC family transcriptional regulator
MQDTYYRESIEALEEREQDSQFAEYAPPTPPGVPDCSLEKLRTAVADLLCAVGSVSQDDPEDACEYVSRAAALLRLESPGAIRSSDRYGTKCAAPSVPRRGLAPWQVRKVSAYIEAHLDSTVDTPALASLVKLSVFHFCRAFQASFGESPHTYVMRRRVECAQGLMLQTKSPLAQIAIECGLSDQAHFSKSFRRFVGESPGAWRRARAAPVR